MDRSTVAVEAASKPAALAKVAFRSSSDHPDTSEAQIGNVRLRLAHPDHAEHPSAWEGPLEIHDASTSCQSDVSLVTAVYASPDVSILLVVSYSGSLTYVDFIDRTCRHAWPQIKAFTEGVQVAEDQLTILPGCEGSGAKGPATCSAAQVFAFKGDSEPVLQQKESLALTKKIIGVEFQGSRKVLNPKSAQANLVQ